jgi:hypothetical protein
MSLLSRIKGIHPVRAFKKSHRGEPNPIWLMTATAPFEVPIVTYFALLGIFALIVETPGSITESLDHWVIIAWGLTFALGGIIALVGRYMQAFTMESAGLGLLAGGFATYAGVAVWVNGTNAIFAAGAYVALVTGCIIRIRVILKDRKARRVAGDIIRERQNGDAPS